MQIKHLIGNERLKKSLAPFFKVNFPQSIIIEGERGTGKKTLAQDIAAALLCEGENPPCGKCGACARMNAGSHPDYHVFNESGEAVKVDDVREIRRQSFIRPSEASQKIFVINCAHLINVQAQNALLKVLEEPQETIFLLLCENTHAMLQTVRSRCSLFTMDELSDDLIESELLKMRPSVEKEKIRAAAVKARGSLGRAIEAIDGDGEKADALADEFVTALTHSELKTLEVCLKTAALSREDCVSFCDSACLLLCDIAKRGSDGSYAIPIYDKLRECSARLNQNASVSAICGSIAAFCGNLIFR